MSCSASSPIFTGKNNGQRLKHFIHPDPRLAAAGEPIRSRFEEARSNPFHRLPKRFEGVIRWDPEIGLSLYYFKPSELIINILPRGVFAGRPDQEIEPIAGSEQESVMLLFSKLFNWDVSWLARNFSTEGEMGEDGNWKISLRPDDGDLAGKLDRIDLEGQGGLLNRILLDLRNGRTVEISLSGQERPAPVDETELKEFYPALNAQ